MRDYIYIYEGSNLLCFVALVDNHISILQQVFFERPIWVLLESLSSMSLFFLAVLPSLLSPSSLTRVQTCTLSNENAEFSLDYQEIPFSVFSGFTVNIWSFLY